jgi:hypothetical protein
MMSTRSEEDPGRLETLFAPAGIFGVASTVPRLAFDDARVEPATAGGFAPAGRGAPTEMRAKIRMAEVTATERQALDGGRARPRNP